MPLRLFRRENSSAAQKEREERIERAVVEGFRTLADFLKVAADAIEAKRLEKRGFDKQEKFLERSDRKRR
jgi:hypothetical protein